MRKVPGLGPVPDDGLPCSRCPVLDLGTEYPAKDPRDPWRRMPQLFLAASAILGSGMMNRKGKPRLELERRVGGYCRQMRERHGPCNRTRMGLCAGVLRGVMESARKEPPAKRRAALNARIVWLIADDLHHERMKATRTSLPTQTMIVPPITMQEVADA